MPPRSSEMIVPNLRLRATAAIREVEGRALGIDAACQAELRVGAVAQLAGKVPFLIEGKLVILIDDVLYTGRTVRAAMDAMMAFGRPQEVELLVLIDRKYSRDVPIQPNYVGKEVTCIDSEKVVVDLREVEDKKEIIWLVKK